jgi:hypothetical protein
VQTTNLKSSNTFQPPSSLLLLLTEKTREQRTHTNPQASTL